MLKNGGDAFRIINAGGVCDGKHFSLCIFSQSSYIHCVHGHVRSLTDNESRDTAKRIICFRGSQTAHVAARNERLTPPQRIVTRIIRDISRCPHRPVVGKFYSPAPYFYFPGDVGTCLSLSPEYLITYIVTVHTVLHTWLHNYVYNVRDMLAPAKQTVTVIFYTGVLISEPNCTTSHYCIDHSIFLEPSHTNLWFSLLLYGILF